MNLVTVLGRLARPAEERILPSGDRLVAYEVTVPRPAGRAETVPVVWFDAPARALELAVDEEVVVIGRVRRRFFRAGDTTQSRTEVVAETVVPARHAKRVRVALDRVRTQLEELATNQYAGRS
jgi:single-strand DNA-binding protein